MRGSSASAPASHSCSSARVIESSEANGSSSSRTGLPASSVRANATRWRIPPDSSYGPRAGELRRGRSARTAAAPARRASGAPRAAAARARARRCRAPSATAAAGRAAASGRSGAAARAAATVPVDRDRARGRLLEAADQLEQRRLAAAGRARRCPSTSPGATASVSVPQRRHRRRAPGEGLRQRRDVDRRRAGPARRWRLPRGSLRRDIGRCSLRGHYPTGSKGQRREGCVP